MSKATSSGSYSSASRRTQTANARRLIRNRGKRVVWITAALAGTAGFLQNRAHAQTLTWDPLSNTTGSDGNGTWNAGSGTNFASGGADAPWSNGNAAVFGSGTAGSYNVAIGTPIVTTGITINAGTNYNISGTFANPLNLSGGTINFSANTTLSGVNLAGTNITLNGSSGSTLTLAGASVGSSNISQSAVNSFTGNLIIAGGTVLANYTGSGFYSPFQHSQGIIVNAGATLIDGNSSGIGSAYAPPTITLGTGSTLTYNGGGTYQQNITMTGSTVNGTGSLINYYGTYTTLASSNTSTMTVGVQTNYQSFTANVSAGTTASGIDFLMSGVLSSSGGISKSGAGVLELTAINTDTGTNTISGGTVTVASGAVLAANSAPLVVSANTSTGVSSSILNSAGSLSVGSLSGTLIGTGASATINILGSFNDSQGTTTTYAGTYNSSGSLTLTSNGTLHLTGAVTIPGAVTLSNGGSLYLDGTYGSTGTTLTMGGGNFQTSSGALAFTGLTLNAGAAVINAVNMGSSNALALGSITRGSFSTVDVTLPTAGGSVTTTAPNTTGSILAGWATVNSGAAWAVSSGSAGSPGAISAFSSGAATYSNNYASFNSTTDFNPTATGSFTVSGSTTYVNSLQFNTAAAVAATVPFGFGVASGGILNSPSVGANISSITGGSITSGLAGELIVNQYNTSVLNIGSKIVDNGAAMALTKSGTGPLTLSAANTYSGGTYEQAGEILITNSAALGTGPLYVGIGAPSGTGASSANPSFLDLTGITQLNPVIPNVLANNIVFPNPGATTYYTMQISSGSTSPMTFSGVISGGGSNANIELNDNLTGDAAGTYILTGTNTFVGNWDLNRGGLTVSSDASLGPDSDSLSIVTNPGTTETFLNSMTFGHNISQGQTAYFNVGTNTVTLSGVLSGSGSTTLIGGGTLNLNNSGNTYTGTFALDSGKLQLGTAGTWNSSSATSNIQLSGGTLAIVSGHTSSQYIATTSVLYGQSGVSAGNFSSSAYNLGLGVITRTLGAELNFTLPGTGHIDLNNSNTATTILGGWATANSNTWAVSAGTGTATGAVSGLATFNTSYAAATIGDFDATTSGTFTPTTINSLRFNTASVAANTGSGTLTIASGGILVSSAATSGSITGAGITSGTNELIVNQFNTASPFTISAPIVNNGSSATAVTIAGPGTVVLGGVNTYNGSTYVVGGATLSVTADANLGLIPSAATPGSLVLNNGTLLAPSTFTMNSSRGITLGVDNGTINVSSGATLTYAGIIANGPTAASLTKTGLGTLVLSAASTFTGGTFVNAGTLTLSNGNNVSPVRGVLTINSGGSVFVSGFTALGQNTYPTPIIINTGGTLNSSGGQPVSWSSNFILNGGSIIGGNANSIALTSGHSISTIGGSNTSTIATTIYGASSTDAITFNVAAGTTTSGIDLLVSGTVAGYSAAGTSIIKNGLGTMEMTGSGSTYSYGGGFVYTGGTQINAGTLIVASPNTAFNTSVIPNGINISSGATLAFTGSDLTNVSNTVNVNGGATFTVQNANSPTGANTYYMGTVNLNSSNGLAAVASSPDGSTFRFGYNGNGLITSNGAINNTDSQGIQLVNGSSHTMTVTANNTLTLSGAINELPSYLGEQLIFNGTGTAILTGANSYTGTTTISSGVLQVGNGGTSGNLGSGPVVNNGSLVLDNNSSYTVPNAISGSGGLTQVTGTVTMTGNSTFSGPTVIGGGKLYMNGTSNNSSGVLVANAATLGGTGTFNAPVTVASGGITEAGTGGTGTLTVGSLVYNGTGTINIGTLANYTTTAAITDLGMLSANGSANSVTINIGNLVGANPGSTYILLSYNGNSGNVGGTEGYPAFTLATLPGRSSATLTNVNNGDGTGDIELTVNSSDYLLWTGSNNGVANTSWDTVTPNWVLNSSSGTPTTYVDSPGDAVMFADSAGSSPVLTTTVNIGSGTVHPSAVTFNNTTSTYTVTGVFGIAGTTGITKYGSGTVLLSTPNSFTGAININAGTIDATGNTTALGTPASVTIASGSTLIIPAGAATNSFPLSVGGSGALGQAGAFVSTGNNSIGGLLTLTGAATIASTSGTLTFANTGTITGTGGALTLAGAGNGVINSVLNNSGGLIMNSTGTWTLNGLNSYPGPTNVNSGTLIVTNRAPNIGSGYTYPNAQVYNVAAAATLDLEYSETSYPYNSAVNLVGAGVNASTGLNILGGVTQWLNSGINITTAPTTIRNIGTGTATIQTWTNSSILNLAAAASGTVITSGITVAATDYGDTLTLAPGANTATGDLTINGAMPGSASNANSTTDGFPVKVDWTITGGGSLLLNGTNTESDGMLISNGSLILGGNNRLPVATGLILGNTSTYGKLVLNGFNQSVGYLASYSTTNTSNAVVNGSATPSVFTVYYNTSGGTDTYAGSLGGAGANQSNFSLVKTGQGTFVLTASNLYADGTNVSNGTLTGSVGSFGTGNLLVNALTTSATVNSNQSIGTTAAVTVNSNGSNVGTIYFNNTSETIGSLAGTGSVVLNNGAGTTLSTGNATNTTFSGNITDPSNSSGIIKAGSGTFTLSGTNQYGGPTNVSSGTLVITADSALPSGNNVSVATGATLVLPDQTSASSVSSLNINGNAVVHGGSLSTLTASVAQGYNGGAWNGTGSGTISSTAAATDTASLHAIGVIQNDNGMGTGTALYTSFEGQSVADSDVLVKYTYYGDADLNGKVDGSDYSRIDNGYLNNLTGWFNGDFNYDGVINGSDYTLIDNAYNTQGAQISAEVASATAQVAGGTSAVPEPASLSLLGFGAIGLLGRRRRRV